MLDPLFYTKAEREALKPKLAEALEDLMASFGVIRLRFTHLKGNTFHPAVGQFCDGGYITPRQVTGAIHAFCADNEIVTAGFQFYGRFDLDGTFIYELDLMEVQRMHLPR